MKQDSRPQNAGPQTSVAFSAALRRSSSLDSLTDKRLLRALDWWRALPRAAAAGLPDRAAIEPGKIVDLLPYAILWDVNIGETGALLYRCRLAGTMLVEIYGRECTGMTLSEKFGADAPRMQADLDTVVHDRRPLQAEYRMSWADKDYYKYRRLMLPFTHHARLKPGDDPDRVALLFNVISFMPE